MVISPFYENIIRVTVTVWIFAVCYFLYQLDQLLNKNLSNNTENIKVDVQEKKYSFEELLLTSTMLFNECNTCISEEQDSIVQTVINRKKDNQFPNTLKEVLLAKDQFSISQETLKFTVQNFQMAKKVLERDAHTDVLYFLSTYPSWTKNVDLIVGAKKDFHHNFYK